MADDQPGHGPGPLVVAFRSCQCNVSDCFCRGVDLVRRWVIAASRTILPCSDTGSRFSLLFCTVFYYFRFITRVLFCFCLSDVPRNNGPPYCCSFSCWRWAHYEKLKPVAKAMITAVAVHTLIIIAERSFVLARLLDLPNHGDEEAWWMFILILAAAILQMVLVFYAAMKCNVSPRVSDEWK